MGMASKILDHQQQMNLLDQTKTLAESALQMLYAAKEGGGNPKVHLKKWIHSQYILLKWVANVYKTKHAVQVEKVTVVSEWPSILTRLIMSLCVGDSYPWCHSRSCPAHERSCWWSHVDPEWSCQWGWLGQWHGGLDRWCHGQGRNHYPNTSVDKTMLFSI